MTLKEFYIFRQTDELSVIYVNFRQCYSKKDKYLNEMIERIRLAYPKDKILLLQEIGRFEQN